ncbi:MAG: HAMP domain-containing histidine kinase [Oligoflexia bacterium]|nr:HAMP domain-containing histidine kinase [Oligoflexia bacterium]
MLFFFNGKQELLDTFSRSVHNDIAVGNNRYAALKLNFLNDNYFEKIYLNFEDDKYLTVLNSQNKSLWEIKIRSLIKLSDSSKKKTYVVGIISLKKYVPLFILINCVYLSVLLLVSFFLRKQSQKIRNAELKELLAKSRLKITKSVAHDIRSPLTALEMMVGQMNEISREKKKNALQAIGRIQDIANGLLQNKIVDEALMVPVRSIVENLLTEKRESLKKTKKKIDLQFEFDKTSYGIFSDVPQMLLKRVLSNLINNAAEALDEEGKIVIRLEKEGGDFSLIVNDNGKGIPEKVLKEIKNRKNVTFGKVNGNGIGLMHAFETMDTYNGIIEINSSEDNGTEVAIKLPAAQVPRWFCNEIKIVSDNIIIFDDDESIHNSWKSILAGRDLSIYSAFKKSELLALTDEIENYQVISDYDLGEEQSGLDVIESLSIQDRAILVTSFYNERDVQDKSDSLGVKIIPKEYFPHAPIKDLRNSEIVFVDDEMLLRKGWELEAKNKGIKCDSYSSSEDLKAMISNYDTNTAFYIDKELNGEDGLELCQWLGEKGFNHIHLATGHSPSDFRDATYLSAVVGKEFPL